MKSYPYSLFIIEYLQNVFNLLPNLNISELIKAFAGQWSKIIIQPSSGFYLKYLTCFTFYTLLQWKQMIWCWSSICLLWSEVSLPYTTWSTTRSFSFLRSVCNFLCELVVLVLWSLRTSSLVGQFDVFKLSVVLVPHYRANDNLL